MTEAIGALEQRVFEFPLHTRLCRRLEVEEWALAGGRRIADTADLDSTGSDGDAVRQLRCACPHT
jgi:hypothetical protein